MLPDKSKSNYYVGGEPGEEGIFTPPTSQQNHFIVLLMYFFYFCSVPETNPSENVLEEIQTADIQAVNSFYRICLL